MTFPRTHLGKPMRRALLAPLLPLALLFPAAAAAQDAGEPTTQITDTIQAPLAMSAAVQKYMICLSTAFVDAKPNAAADFPALTEQVIAGCKRVRAEAFDDAQKQLGPEARPGDNAVVINAAFDSIDASFRGLVLRVRDELTKQPAK